MPAAHALEGKLSQAAVRPASGICKARRRDIALGKRGFIRVDARRLGRDGMQGGFCSKYLDICKKTNAADRPSQVIARHDE